MRINQVKELLINFDFTLGEEGMTSCGWKLKTNPENNLLNGNSKCDRIIWKASAKTSYKGVDAVVEKASQSN